jgi:proteasome lid subunit RPN8/RPN11
MSLRETLTHPDLLTAIRAHGEHEYPRESCGLVIDGDYYGIKNGHPDPTHHFFIDPEIVATYRKYGTIQAVIHSHPDPLPDDQRMHLSMAGPSRADMAAQIACGIPFGIVTVDRGNAGDVYFWGDGLEPLELLGRPFRHGVTDCYSLVRDYYMTEHKITLPEVPRDDRWWDLGQSLYLDHFEAAGFTVLGGREALSQLRPGDGLLASIRSSVPNHAAIYVGDGLILHHLPKRLSAREPASAFTSARLHAVLRHKDLNP